MRRIASANATVDNKFQDANSGSGQKATSWEAEWPNGVQEELVGIIELAGRTPTGGVYNQVFRSIVDLIYRVGDYIHSENDDVTPGQRYPWQTWAEVMGCFLVGRDTSQTEFNATGKTAGSKTATLSANNLPAHNHQPADDGNGTAYGFIGKSISGQSNTQDSSDSVNSGSEPNIVSPPVAPATVGQSTPFSVLPPYRTVRMWRRTA